MVHGHEGLAAHDQEVLVLSNLVEVDLGNHGLAVLVGLLSLFSLVLLAIVVLILVMEGLGSHGPVVLVDLLFLFSLVIQVLVVLILAMEDSGSHGLAVLADLLSLFFLVLVDLLLVIVVMPLVVVELDNHDQLVEAEDLFWVLLAYLEMEVVAVANLDAMELVVVYKVL